MDRIEKIGIWMVVVIVVGLSLSLPFIIAEAGTSLNPTGNVNWITSLETRIDNLEKRVDVLEKK